MLNAILHGKKYSTGLEGIWLSTDFVGAEDTLTSTVFERLLYLPDEQIISILFNQSLWINSATKPPREIISHEFWPWWEPPKITEAAGLDTTNPSDVPNGAEVATDDQKFIQPDLVIRFDDRVLIIEAKRWDFRSGQSWTQLARQYARASLRFPGMPIWQMAVGGLPDERRSTIDGLRNDTLKQLRKLDLSCPHKDFYFGAVAWYRLFKITADVCGDVAVYRRLMVDLRKGLSAHGIQVEPPQWLGELTSEKWRSAIGTITSSALVFRPTIAKALPLIGGISSSSISTLARRGV